MHGCQAGDSRVGGAELLGVYFCPSVQMVGVGMPLPGAWQPGTLGVMKGHSFLRSKHFFCPASQKKEEQSSAMWQAILHSSSVTGTRLPE